MCIVAAQTDLCDGDAGASENEFNSSSRNMGAEFEEHLKVAVAALLPEHSRPAEGRARL